MDVEKLIRRLRNDADAYRNGETLGRAFADQEDVLDNAATALSTLQTENAQLHRRLSEATSACSRIAEWAQNTGHDYVEGVAKEFLEGTNDGL